MRIGSLTEPNGDGAAGQPEVACAREHLDVGEEDVLLLHHVLCHLLGHAFEEARDLDHLGVALAVLRGDLGGVRQEGRDRAPDVGVVGGDDVVHERGGVHGRVVLVGGAGRGGQAGQLGEHRLGRHAGLAARRANRACAPAAVVDPVLFEDGRGPEIAGHDVANGRFGGGRVHFVSLLVPLGNAFRVEGEPIGAYDPDQVGNYSLGTTIHRTM